MKQESLLEIQFESLTSIELLSGEETFSLLSDSDFLIEWDSIYNSCPWATVYQSREFVSNWYRIYHKKYLPIVVRAVAEGKLIGLLTLAKDKNGLIIGAGASLAEYQVWLSAPDNGKFIKDALLKVRKQFAGCDIHLKFIPEKAPVEWIETDAMWKRRCVLKVYQQPLMIADEANISTELKKFNKKINRLKKLGDLKFDRVKDFETFSSIFDELAVQYDFRKGAMYNKTYFQKDSSRKELFLSLFEENILHVTILRLNDEIIAFNVGAISKKLVHFHGINAHAPTHAKSSPGILHILMLGKLLAEEGIDMLDLTPGENSYKGELATAHVPVYELSVAGSAKFHVKKVGDNFFYLLLINKKKILNALAKFGVTPNNLKNGARKIAIVKERITEDGSQGLRTFLAELVVSLKTKQVNKIYKIEPGLTNHSVSIKKNNLSDLLAYQSKDSKLTKWEFLYDALRKLEKKQHVYSLLGKTGLITCVWVKEEVNENANPDLKDASGLPNGSILLYDFYCHPDGSEKMKAFIKTVVHEVSNTRNEGTYAIIDGSNKTLSRTLEAIGFVENQASEHNKQ